MQTLILTTENESQTDLLIKLARELHIKVLLVPDKETAEKMALAQVAEASFAKDWNIQTGSTRFHAATNSIRHKSRRMGVTVARLENHSLPLRISSKRMFGNTKSIVVETGSPVMRFNN